MSVSCALAVADNKAQGIFETILHISSANVYCDGISSVALPASYSLVFDRSNSSMMMGGEPSHFYWGF